MSPNNIKFIKTDIQGNRINPKTTDEAVIMGNGQTLAQYLEGLNTQIGNIPTSLSNEYTYSPETNKDLEPTKNDSFETAISKLHKSILDNEVVTSSAIVNLVERIGLDSNGNINFETEKLDNKSIIEAIDILANDSYTEEAAQSYVLTKIAELVDGAPEQFDTLKEIAYILNMEPGTEAAILTAISQKADSSALNNYLTVDNAATIYQPKGDYVTITDAETNYQPKGDYLTEHQSLTLSDDYEMSEEENENLEVTGGDTFEEAISKLHKAIVDNEDVATTTMSYIVEAVGLTNGIHPEFESESLQNKTIVEAIDTLANSTNMDEVHAVLASYVTKNQLSNQAYITPTKLVAQAYVTSTTLENSIKLSNNYGPSELLNDALEPAKNDTFETAISKLHKAILDDEVATTGTIIELAKKLGLTQNLEPEFTNTDLQGKTFVEAIDYIKDNSYSEENAKSYVATKINELVNGAPTTLDTLKEISDVLTMEEGASAAILEAIGNRPTSEFTNANYVSYAFLNSQGYLTSHQSLVDYAKTSDVHTILSSYVTKDYLEDQSYLTTTSASNLYQPKGDYLTEHQDLKLSADYQPSEETNQNLEPEGNDTFEEAISKLHKAIIDNELVTSEAIVNLVEQIGLDTNGNINFTSEKLNDKNIIEAIDSLANSTSMSEVHDVLSAYVTKQYLTNQSYVTTNYLESNYQPVGEYLTTTDAESNYQPVGDYLTTTSASNLYQPKGNYLTSHQSLTLSNEYAPSNETNTQLEPAKNDTFEVAIGKLHKAILDNELVTSESIAQLVNEIGLQEDLTVEFETESLNGKSIVEAIDELAENAYTEEDAKSYVVTKINEIIDGAPEQFDTLKEISNVLKMEENAEAAILTAISDRTTFAYVSETYQPKGNYLTAHQDLKLSNNYEMSNLENDALEPEGNDTFEEAIGKLHKAIIDNELVSSTAISVMAEKVGMDENFNINFTNSELEGKTMVEVIESLVDVTSELLFVSTTYAKLVELKNNSQLIPGTLYRITDYTCKTTQEETRSAGHWFDIIVLALTSNSLSDDAKAVKHEGDNYFNNCNLDAWTLKYTLDNSLYSWGDTTNGKGVIYYMKDEFFNEAYYDFKNIQYKRYKITASTKNPEFVGKYYAYDTDVEYCTVDSSDYKWCYTFIDTDYTDATVNFYITHTTLIGHNKIINIIEGYPTLNNVVCLANNNYLFNNIIEYGYSLNINGGYNNKLYLCGGVIIGDLAIANEFNFSSNCLIGNSAIANKLSVSESIILGNCNSNNIISEGNYISTKDNCSNNTFGKSCSYIEIGSNNENNTFGDGCSHISFSSRGLVLSYCTYLSFDNYVQNVTLAHKNNIPCTSSERPQNLHFNQGNYNNSVIQLDKFNSTTVYDYTINSNGDVIDYCFADLLGRMVFCDPS